LISNFDSFQFFCSNFELFCFLFFHVFFPLGLLQLKFQHVVGVGFLLKLLFPQVARAVCLIEMPPRLSLRSICDEPEWRGAFSVVQRGKRAGEIRCRYFVKSRFAGAPTVFFCFPWCQCKVLPFLSSVCVETHLKLTARGSVFSFVCLFGFLVCCALVTTPNPLYA
jgi:hypothetical protein